MSAGNRNDEDTSAYNRKFSVVPSHGARCCLDAFNNRVLRDIQDPCGKVYLEGGAIDVDRLRVGNNKMTGTAGIGLNVRIFDTRSGW